MPTIKLQTLINAPPELIFDLSRSVEIHTQSLTYSKERVVAGVTNGLIGLGETVTWEAVHFGIKQRLTARITEFERPDYFVDEMVRGAFKKFRHLHSFFAVDGGTEMVDEFDYQSPLGWLGRLADKLFLEKYMRNLLLTRGIFLKREAEKAVENFRN